MASNQTFRDHIVRNERDVPHPYLDSKGLITIGPGLKIEGRNAEETKQNFMKLNLQIQDPETKELRPATDNEKRQALQAMQVEQAKGAGNRGADAYNKTTPLTLPQPERDRLLDEQVNTRVDAVKKEVGSEAWERLNDGQKAAVLDVHYANGNLKDFPKLKKAIEDGNAEDNRPSRSPLRSRNPNRNLRSRRPNHSRNPPRHRNKSSPRRWPIPAPRPWWRWPSRRSAIPANRRC